MTDKRQMPDGEGGSVTVLVRRDKRLRKYARANMQSGEVLVRVPPRMSDADIDKIVGELVEKLLKRQARSRRLENSDLAARAARLNKRYFGGELHWNSIRWVTNMRSRLGSCTNAGLTDGDIRISHRIRNWPEWVIDYIVAHEIVHRAHPDHSPAFWEMLGRYPYVERARGFVEGVEYGLNGRLQ